jgi:hypothetical protein
MTKMVSKILGVDWVENEDTNDVMECLVSDDKFELLELVVDRMKSLDVGESVMVNLVNEMDEEDRKLLEDGYLKGDGVAKVEIVYTNDSAFNNN